MANLDYGPVDLYLVGFEGDRPSPGVVEAIGELIEGGELRLLDFLVISRHEDGAVFITEFDDVRDEYGFGTVALEAVGLVSDEDAEELADGIPPGTSGVLLAVELLWAKRLASRFAVSGGVVLQTGRIPAPVVNAALAEAEGEIEMAAPTAVVAGTATAVPGGVRSHQHAKADQQYEAQQQAQMDAAAQQAAKAAAAPAPAPAAAGGTDIVAELQKLEALRVKGILSHDEFAAAKAKLLE